MAIKVNAQVTGYGPQPANTQALVVVTVEFDGGSEAMTFTVLVPNDGDEGVIREQAIARAQDLARRFAEVRRAPDRARRPLGTGGREAPFARQKNPGQRDEMAGARCCFNKSNDIEKSDSRVILLLDAPIETPL
jgi:hypothetical protein